MKKMVLFLTLLILVLATTVCSAENTIPDLVGTWSVKSEAAVLAKGEDPGEWTHHKDSHSQLSAEITIFKQQGRIFYATFTSRMAKENMAGVIGWDNKTLYLVDMDGFTDATLVSKDKITCIYRHVGPKDSVVAAGVWTRRK